jgi:hypothetical protein
MPAAGSSSAISLGVGGQRARDLQPPLVAVAQGAGAELGITADAHVVQQFLRALRNGGFFGLEAGGAKDRAEQARMRAHVAPDHDVFQRGHLGEQPDVLEGARDPLFGHLVHGTGLVGFAA